MRRASSSFFARLLRRPLWLAGLALELGAGTVFFLLAQVRLGPALIPGLMATGLILLAVDLSSYDILDAGFLVRAAAFSAAVTALFFALRLRPVAGRGAKPAIRGVSAALGSGLLYVLSNFWVGPFAAPCCACSGASWGCRCGRCSFSARRRWC